MNKITKLILVLLIIAVSCKDFASEANKKQVNELNEKAIESRMKGDLETAKLYYNQALAIDSLNTFMYYEFIQVYIQQDSLNKALTLLNNMPLQQNETAYAYQSKGELYEYLKQMDKAVACYKKALKLTNKPKVENETDLMPFVNYTLLQTLAGQKEQAVHQLNLILNLDWLTTANIDYLTTFRNEFEYYQGRGTKEFTPKHDIVIKTTKADSLRSVLKAHHINISGSRIKNDTTEIYISEKFRQGVAQLQGRQK